MNIHMERSYQTPVSNSTLLPLLLLSLARQRHTPHSSTSIKDEYDYIVVGGGAAGSVVASRLSEETQVSVLLVEAGLEPPLLTEVPAFFAYYPRTNTSWNFVTVPQKHGSTGLKNRQSYWSLGKMLGGSSSHNGMAYFRGNWKNYDDWEAQGCKGWSSKGVFPYFLKLEDNRDPDFLANGYHATGGPITVKKPTYESDIKKVLNKAVKSLGYKFVDSNAARQSGFASLQHNIRDGQRCSSVKGYLVHAENRTNLDILLNAQVTKIITNNVHGYARATGVKYFHNNQSRTIKAKREVVVSAGAVNSPKLLLLSGIGPREDLKRLNIPVISDLPVGKNLQVHISSFYYVTLSPGSETIDEKLSKDANILQYINHRSGPLSEPLLMEGFLNGRNMTPCVDFPAYSLVAAEMSKAPMNEGFTPEVEKYFRTVENKPGIQGIVEILQPKSRGTISLSSSNAFDPPLIDPNFNPSDLEDIADGLKMWKKITGTAPALRFGIRPIENPLPGCELYEGFEDEYFKCYARTVTFPRDHEVGTCKMGGPRDPTAVVDPELRVKNIKGLRVVDASIMPRIPSGNTHVSTLMIGEKASDMIKKSIHSSKRNAQCHKNTF